MGHLRCLSPYAGGKEDSRVAEVNSWRIEPTIEKISVVTPRVANMMNSVRFYRDVLGMELLYVERARVSLHGAQKTHNLRSSIWKQATR